MAAELKHHASSNEYSNCAELRNTYCDRNRFSLYKTGNKALLSGISVFCLGLSEAVVTSECKGLFPRLSALKKKRKPN